MEFLNLQWYSEYHIYNQSIRYVSYLKKRNTGTAVFNGHPTITET
jgi:hypothetical protein